MGYRCAHERIPSQVKVEFGARTLTFDVIKEPVPHIVVEGSRKELHGWWPGKRECTAERMLVNPYNGCTHNCLFCYAHAFWGYFQVFRRYHVVSVFKDFAGNVARQLDGLNIASTGYLSPVTDPFQPINEKYRLSEKVIKVFTERNIPIEFITKGAVSDEVIDLIRRQSHSFGQVSILTIDEDLRRRLVPGGATTDQLFDNLKRLAESGVYVVCRMDPIIPLITDDEENLSQLVSRSASAGAKHIVTSCMDIPWKIKKEIVEGLSAINPKVRGEYPRLYTEEIDGYLNAGINYRRELFSKVGELCSEHGLTFALCMEYQLVDGRPIGLNKDFMTSVNCEGIDIPIYIRKGEKFEPATNCSGACLTCVEARCGIDDLAMGREESRKDWRLEDYKRWSKQILGQMQEKLF
ncbi:MAG: radical SAM protein [Actinomycetota bacterium]|nr:radical SAM protein [Actinomycetota bacterium]